MKNKILRIILTLIGIAVFSPMGAQKYTSGANHPFHSPTPGEITIMAVSPFPPGIQPSKQAFQDLESCGFNLTTSQGTIDYFKNVFSILGDMKLRYLISNPNFVEKNVRQSYMSAFRGNPHLGGWLLRDEPPFDIWQSLSQQYKEFYTEAPNSFIYVNLVGIIYQQFTGPAKTIPQYLENFQNQFAPALWSYDYYPIYIQNGKLNINSEHFYYDLETFSSMAKKTSRPFWTFCESIGYTTSSYSRPAPTEAYLKFEAYNALAYGAQGIVYWSYAMRNPSGGENYTSALVDLKGRKSKAWFAAQKVNQQIKKFNDVFYECDVKEIRHTGDKIYNGTHKLSGAFGPFSMIRSGSEGVVASRIENNGKTYIVLVNRDVNAKQKVTLELSGTQKVVNLTSPKQDQYAGVTEIALTLDKADWAIFQVL